MRERRRFMLVIIAAAVAASGCGSSSSTSLLAPGLGVGIYSLESVTGNGPETGSFVLSLDGTATRRVRYAGIYATGEYVAVGTFELTPDSIRFALREDAGTSPYVWRVQGARSGDAFTIRYPDPADGSVTETYRRR